MEYLTWIVVIEMVAMGMGFLLGRMVKGLDRTDKRESNPDNDIRIYVPSRCRDRSLDNGLDKPLESGHTVDEKIQVLQVLRMYYACKYERDILNEIIDQLKGEG